eukprot:sb/3467074/
MHLAVYDVMMGVYMVLLVAMGTVMGSRGDFCTQHDWWRSSGQCIALGCIFSISVHGSLLTITSLSVLRAVRGIYTCTVRVAWVVCGGVGVVNLLQAALPILPYIRDTFRTGLVLVLGGRNPFLEGSKFNESHFARMYSLLNNKSHGVQISQVMEGLHNITTKPEIFYYYDIGYYGNNLLCVANPFLDNQPLKLGYCGTVGIIVITLLISFIYMIKTRYTTGRKDVIRLNLGLLIGTKMLVWICYLVVMVIYGWVNTITQPPLEVFSLVVFPGNSLLNPVSKRIWKTVSDRGWKLWRRVVTMATRDNDGNEG